MPSGSWNTLLRSGISRPSSFNPVDSTPRLNTPINDRELWPYYEKIVELDIPLFLHAGFSWCIPGRSMNAVPWLLEDVCEDFPELTVLAYHMAYPFTDALNMCALKYPNLYVGTSLLPYFGRGASRKAQKLLGEAISWAGIDKIVWGTDLGASQDEVDILTNFQISEELQAEYGYQPLSQEGQREMGRPQSGQDTENESSSRLKSTPAQRFGRGAHS